MTPARPQWKAFADGGTPLARPRFRMQRGSISAVTLREATAGESIFRKYELALLAEETGIEIHVSHFPPGASKWNKIEHRLFCYISRNWAGKPLPDIRTVVRLIGSTTTKNGLKVRGVVDRNQYPTGIKISEKQMACLLNALRPF